VELSENSKKVTHNKGRERLLQGKSRAVMKKQKINVDISLLRRQQRLQPIKKTRLKPSLRGVGKSVKKSQTTFEESHPCCVYQITKYQICTIYSQNTTMLCYEVLYNFQLHVSATLLGHYQVLYLAYRGMCHITSVTNGRQDLVYNGQVYKLN